MMRHANIANDAKQLHIGSILKPNDTPTPTIYIDLDGTLLGNNASLLHDHTGARNNVGIDALELAEKAGVDLVVATGRDVYRTSEFCRSAGISKYIAELGCVLHTTGEDIVEYGDVANAFMKDNDVGAPEFMGYLSDAGHMLIEHFAGQLELHVPYNRDRYASLLMRGNVSIEKANALLEENGWPFLDLVANGHGMFRRTMPGVDNVLIYHVAPKGVTKAFGISRDQELRNLDPEHCYMIGDGMADAQCHDVVNTVYIPSNGLESDPDVKDFVANHSNIVALSQSHNKGFAEAIKLILNKY